MERVPIDKAVMEHAPNVRVLEVIYDWNDVGDWRSLAALINPDAQGNSVQGPVRLVDTSNSIVLSEHGDLIATLGVDDLVIVQSAGDAGRSQGSTRQAQGVGRRTRRRRIRLGAITVSAPSRILGLDFGTKRVGAAVSDPRRSIASPLEVYEPRPTPRRPPLQKPRR